MKNWFRNKDKRKIFSAISIVVILLALPLTLILVRQAQDLRGRAAVSAPAYMESGGSVVMEAETHDYNSSNGTPHYWGLNSGGTYPVVGGTINYLQSLPNNGTTYFGGQASPELRFNMWITNPGTYYAYLRSSGPNSDADSVHVGLDGGQQQNVGTYYKGKKGYTSDWSWDGGGPVALSIPTAGFHTFHIWAREDGAKIDRIRLVQNPSWQPSVNHSDYGPDTSPRSTVMAGTPTPVPVTIAPVLPKGFHDSSTCQLTYGWACDADDYNQALTIHFYADGPAGQGTFIGSTTANVYRSDLVSAGVCGGTGNHGYNFNTPNSLKTATPRNIYVYAINIGPSTYNPLLESSPKTITCAPPTPTPKPTNTPTPTKTPTPTPTPSQTTLNFQRVNLHGIGAAGTNVNPTDPGTNNNPLTPTRKLTVEFFDSNDNLVKSVQGNVNYSGTNRYFSGNISVSGIPSGNYIIKVKTHKYLRGVLPGIIKITAGTVNIMPEFALVAGDVNSDGVLSILDWNIIVGCYSDILPAANCDATRKFNSDLNDDGLVNQFDINLWIGEASVFFGD